MILCKGQSNMKKSTWRQSVCGGVAISALMLSGIAHAQEAEEAPEVIIENTETEGEARQERIVVTGSLLSRDEFTSSSPVQVITAEVATLEGLVDTANLLQGSSLAAGSTQLNNTFQNFVTNGGVGTQTIDLRGCGDTRTLVLIDGKRPGPSGTRGAVSSLDLNVVPQSIISRVEILKDGASTIYGSDAVCGVVNIITRDSVDGLELNFTGNLPEEEGGSSFRASAAWGFELGDNADFTLSAEYRKAAELDASQRDYLACSEDYVTEPLTGVRADRRNLGAYGSGPTDWCSNLYFNTVIDRFSGERLIQTPDGTTGPTAFGGTIPGYRPRRGSFRGPDGYLAYEDQLDADFLDNEDYFPQNENIALFATSDVELGGITWDSEVLFSRRETEVEGWRQFFPNVGSATNPAGNNPLYGYITDPTYTNDLNTLAQVVMAFPTYDKVTVDYFNASTSFAGGIGQTDWTWKIDGTYSRGEGTYEGNEIQVSKSGDWSLDGVQDYTGDGVPDTVAPPTINYLDPDVLQGNRTAELVAAIGGYQSGETVYEQTTFTAQLANNSIFELPAGDVGLAVGAEYREFSIDDQPGELTQSGDIWGSSTAGPTVGTNSVTEVFAETRIPLLKGQFLAEDVELDASIRAFDYDLGGSDSIYKVGLNWQVNPTFRVRSSYGTSYRAPALFELFLEDQTGFQQQTQFDPCVDWQNSSNPNIRANCAAAGIPGDYTGAGSSALVISSGGGDLLESESGDTFTAGIVFTPTFAPLNIALDYYEIEISDQITSLSASQIVGGCYASTVYPNDFCDLFTRNPGTSNVDPYNVDNIQAPTLNVDSQQQRGIDLEVRYERDFNFGVFTFDASVNWALERYINVFGSDFVSGVTDNDFNGTVGFPSVVGDMLMTLERGDWTYSFFSDFIGRQDDNRYYSDDLNFPVQYVGAFPDEVLYKSFTEAQWVHGASIRWEGDTWTFAGGVRNLFDEHPPAVSPGVVTAVGNTPLNATGYDVFGRTFFTTISKRF
ncbi:MAG: TonB-dependent receptor [Ponticaulis sp.]|nr:TonB-dependent receptor [Ponticaulis sp.]